MREATNYNIKILKGNYMTDPAVIKTIIKDYHEANFYQ